MANRLARETSPYLRQHANNPVDWWPWGEAAFAAARAADKPILLSVGYSSCHWCHVMAHESFEDATTAGLMNDWFINIKVDREERPDVDGVYMSAVQALTGRGGWPMTVFLDHDLRPFYAGTYFPLRDNHGIPAFSRVLQALHETWATERARVLSSAEGITDALRAVARRVPAASPAFGASEADTAVASFRASFDPEWGGFGGAPKFPSPTNLDFLLMSHARTGETGDPSALEMAAFTLVRMAQGGMYDHLGGGFARYSVDQRWLVPHFEKMLYDNAQLARTYLHAHQAQGGPFFAQICRETLGYLEREMLDPAGGFFAAQDADSEGIEGKYFVWTPAEVTEVLGAEAALFCDWFGVSEEGNFADPHHPEFGRRNVLSAWQNPDLVARRHGLTADALAARVDDLRPRMLAARERRVRPGLDDKILTSWNGLALAAFAEAGRVLGDSHYLDVARRNAAFVRERLWRDGRLLHVCTAGVAHVDGMLEDYAFYGLGLVELFKASGDIVCLEWAAELFEAIVARFHDAERGGFFETPADGERLLLREKPTFDGPTPSGNGAAGLLAWWLGRYYGKAEWESLAGEVPALAGEHMAQAPSGFGSMWQLAELRAAPRRELAIVGQPAARAPLEREAATRYLPALLLAPSIDGAGLPVFAGRAPAGGQALAYLCEDMACQLPASTAEDLARQLA